jgi:hypothetical protein
MKSLRKHIEKTLKIIFHIGRPDGDVVVRTGCPVLVVCSFVCCGPDGVCYGSGSSNRPQVVRSSVRTVYATVQSVATARTSSAVASGRCLFCNRPQVVRSCVRTKHVLIQSVCLVCSPSVVQHGVVRTVHIWSGRQ